METLLIEIGAGAIALLFMYLKTRGFFKSESRQNLLDAVEGTVTDIYFRKVKKEKAEGKFGQKEAEDAKAMAMDDLKSMTIKHGTPLVSNLIENAILKFKNR